MIYLPTKFEGDLLKKKGDIAEPIQAVISSDDLNKKKKKKQNENRKVFRFHRTTLKLDHRLSP